MIRKVFLILLCLIILFPVITLAGDARELKVNETIRLYAGGWMYIKSLIENGTDESIGYRGLYKIDGRTYIRIGEFYDGRESSLMIYNSDEKIMCLSPFAFEIVEVRTQFIDLKLLGSCSELYPEQKNEIKSEQNNQEEIKPDLIRK